MILSKKLLLIAATVTLTACGGGSDNGSPSQQTGHPAFKWTDTNVSNNYLPLGNIIDRTPTFTWPAYTDAGLRATEYNFGHESTSGGTWVEYTVSAGVAGCTTGTSCRFTPSNITFNVGDQKAWWVRGKINGQWKEWSSSHVFKIVRTTPPPSGSYQPVGVTPTTNPVFKWPRVGSNTNYRIGIETQAGTSWKTFNTRCTSSVCSATPNFGLHVGDRMTWWIQPIGGAWSDRNDFTVTRTGGGDTQAPTVPTNLRKTAATSTTASMRWNASTDNVAVTGYRIYRNGQQVGTRTNTTFTDSGLQASSAYTYTVRAFDATNNVSGVSNSVSITTGSGGSAGGTISKRVSTGSDDAEEFASGDMYLNSSDLELAYSSSSQTIGMRFTGITIPKNSTITRAYLQFKVDESSSGNVPLTIKAHSSNNAGTFTGSRRNITNRPTTAASISWSPAAWNTVGQAGSNQRTPDIKNVVQEITSRSGWNSGNAIAFIISSNSTGKRVAESFEGDRAGAPLLHIEYTAGNGGGDTQAPTVPASVRKVSATISRVAIRWNASTDNTAVTGYRVYRNGTQIGTTAGITFTDNSVIAATTYAYTVRAYDAANNVSASSTALSVRTPNANVDVVAPTKPANLRKISAVHNRAVIAWNASTDNVAVTGYRIYRNGTQIGTTSTALTFSDTTVRASTTYSYTVKAFDAANNLSLSSTALRVVTPLAPDTQAPTAPPSLVKNKVKAESVSMKWNASTDNRAVTGYKVYRNGVLLKTLAVVLKYKDKTAKPSTTYTYTVKAFDAANNLSVASNALTVTTPSLGRTDIVEPAGIYNTPLNVLDVTIKVLPRTGTTCTTANYDGCTFGKVLQDINWKDQFKPEVKAIFTTADGFTGNATVRQRGGYTRLNPMKSFRVKLDKNAPKWHGERRIQLVKTFDDPLRTKHKLSYDLFTEINKLPSMRARYVRLKVEDKGSFNFAENPSYTILPNYKTTDMGLYLQVEYFGKDYLARRNWIADSRVYKPDHFDFKWHPAAYALDATGKPTNLAAFEAQLEIKSGKDHRAFVEMIQAVSNTSNNFSQVFDKYFDRENYLNWLAVNILTNNNDTVLHNYYLYNPKGTKKFYWIPWDYDGGYNIDVTDVNGNVVDTGPKPPFWYTHGFRWDHPMHKRFLQVAGNAAALKAKVTELRNTVFTNSNVRAKLNSYAAIKPLVTNQPDNLWQYYYQATQAGRNAEFDRRVTKLVNNVAFNYSKFIEYYDNPMPFYIEFAQQQAGLFNAGWEPSVSLAGHTVRYDIVISRTTRFKAADIVRTIRGLTGTRYNAQLNLPRGKYYVKIVSRDTTNPQVRWQAASNDFTIMPLNYSVFGFVEMIVP